MTVAVHIVTWNSQTFLPTLLRSLQTQTFKPTRTLIVDNGSTDGTLEVLRDWKQIHVLRNTRNLGFARAHNQAMAISNVDAVLVTNPDVILESRCLEELVIALNADRRIASVSPKLLRFNLSADDLREPILSDTIDAAGLVARRSRQFVNRGEGGRDDTSFSSPQNVFGAPGVLALYRTEALADVAINGEIFDEDFFAYKEDDDLAWRLQAAGWISRYVPSARAFHHRTLDHHGDRVTNVIKQRPSRSPQLRVLSYRNHLLMLLKNETASTLLPDLPFILWYELKRHVYLLLREWSTLRGFGQALRLAPRILKKRRAFRDRRRVAPSILRAQFSL